MGQRARRWRRRAIFFAIAASLFWGGQKWSQSWHYRHAIRQVEDEMERGLVSRARKDLIELVARYPGSDEALYLLGSAERTRGRLEPAAQAWALVPPDSEFAFRALEGRVEIELEQGRLSEAEQIVKTARDNQHPSREDPSILLGPIYCQQGRVDEAMKLIEALWQRHARTGGAASETVINQLRLYIDLQSHPVPDDTIRAILERAGQVAPDDDRIWLWKARLAIRMRSHAEAERRLDQCLEKRPDDPAVWRARLDWAVAANREAVVRQALQHVSPTQFTTAQIERLAAWFAARRGDREAERQCLERLIAADPTDDDAIDRLTELNAASGRPDAALALGRRKDEIARLEARYQKLFKRHQPRRDAAEMGRLAGQLGRQFEARAFLTLALDAAPERTDLRAELARLAAEHAGESAKSRTLDDLRAQNPPTAEND